MNTRCPICKLPAQEHPSSGDYSVIDCRRCGGFVITRNAEVNLRNEARPPEDGRARVSHGIRRLQGPGRARPRIDSTLADKLAERPLPDPQTQADLYVLHLGEHSRSPAAFIAVPFESMPAILGTADEAEEGTVGEGVKYVLQELERRGLIEVPGPRVGPPGVMRRLTFAGWARYHELLERRIESRTAFMAMSYSNPDLDRAFREGFRPAAAATGFDLQRLDAAPKAGIIDLSLRVEIRKARFLVCDLTDENRGAYWEAGFAEGLGRPVIYTCEADKFDRAKTHFDTEHMLTIKWRLDALAAAADELKTVIRYTLPTEARLTD